MSKMHFFLKSGSYAPIFCLLLTSEKSGQSEKISETSIQDTLQWRFFRESLIFILLIWWWMKVLFWDN